MAKLIKKYSFSKGEISVDENGHYIITEVSKDSTEDYNLSDVINDFIGVAGVSISIGVDDGVEPIIQ